MEISGGQGANGPPSFWIDVIFCLEGGNRDPYLLVTKGIKMQLSPKNIAKISLAPPALAKIY